MAGGFKHLLLHSNPVHPSVHLLTGVPGLSRWVGIVEHSICRKRREEQWTPSFHLHKKNFMMLRESFAGLTKELSSLLRCFVKFSNGSPRGLSRTRGVRSIGSFIPDNLMLIRRSWRANWRLNALSCIPSCLPFFFFGIYTLYLSKAGKSPPT